ncbi:MAG: cytochrome c biogenesis protein [candidate division Zixibacteria bacterium]|nr:cytochrome c biogenesis protein [candidate division Zixibacteria bacterium]
MWWKIILFLAFAVLIVSSFITEAPQQQIGEASRIFYYHIPQAFISVVAFAVSMIYAILFLRTRKSAFDDRAVVAAGLGFVACTLATLTGSVFARVTWGSFWNWDPRETSIFVLLLIYGAYFALRGAIEDDEKRATLSSVYSIFAFVTVPFLVFVMPRVMPSLHPSDSIVDENLRFQMSQTVGTLFFSAMALFFWLYTWIFRLGVRVYSLDRRHEERED